MPASSLEARFKDDTLFVFLEGEAQLVKAWPDLTAVRKRGWRTRWLAFEPAYPLIRPYRPKRPKKRPGKPEQLTLALPAPDEATARAARRPLTPAQLRKRAFDAFRFACPKPVARRVEPFRGDHLTLLRLQLAFGERADLFDNNPALAYCLALAQRAALASPDDDRRRALRALAELKQRELMERLRLPASKRTARAMAKIKPPSLNHDLARELPALLADDEALEAMSHLTQVNLGVLALLVDESLRALTTPPLLEAVLAEPGESYFPFTARRLEEVRHMAQALNVDIARRRFRERERIDALFDDLLRDYERLGRHARDRFPGPPVVGSATIVPLRSAEALVQEGRDQHNCVASYAASVVAGEVYLYRVLKPERATLSLVHWPGGGWQIGELLRAGNQPVSAATTRTVRAWLADQSL